ncbi:MAG: T9SS type A sorting domain-containing protein [Chitinophagaceae bacterium]|nr:T9SS type A sorting domain-containing protein [Chitinophagaceae bacterium]
MKRVTLLGIAILLSIFTWSQTTPGIQWQRAFGGNGSEAPTTVTKTSDGGYIFLSSTDSVSTSITGSHKMGDLWVVKLNATGGIEWHKALGGDDNDLPRQLFANSDGTYTILGQTTSNNYDVSGNHGGGDIWALKLSATGTILWQRCYGGSLSEDIRGSIKNTAGNIVIAGFTQSNDGDITGQHQVSVSDFWILEINNATGSIVAQKAYGGIKSDSPRSIIQLTDGKYVITGFTQSNDGDVSGNHNTTNGDGDIWVLKLNTITALDWQKCLGSPASGSEIGNKISESTTRSVLIIGQVYGNGGDVTGFHGLWDTWMVKLAENGTLLWQRALGGSSAEWPINFYENTDGSIMVLINTVSNDGDVTGYHTGVGMEDLWLVKLNSSGVLQWQKAYGGSTGDGSFPGLSSIFKQTDGNYILAGYTNSDDGDVIGHHRTNTFPGDTANDVWILKVADANGAIQWQRCLGGSSNDYLRAIEQLSPIDFIIGAETFSVNGDLTGPRQSQTPAWDTWIVKLGAINQVKGTVFIDNNNNGIKDPGEPLYSRVQIKSEKPGSIRITTPINGAFLNEVDTGTYVTTLALLYPYFSVSPAQRNSIFTSYFNVDSFGFALAPIVNKKDLQLGIIPLTAARPGFNSQYRVFYENVGTVTLSGSIRFVKDNRTSFISSVPSPSNIISDTLIYNYSNLNPGDSASIGILLNVSAPPVVNINDTLKMGAVILPQAGDETPVNNGDTILQRVRGASDPNDKTEAHGAFISTAEINNGEYLSYLVRFQNTGNDTAFNVIVRDTLDAKLQWDKLQVLSASHPYTLEITGGRYLTWRFTNIKLVDSNRNEPASHGYIYFRIKPLSSLVSGDIIKNAASIYFDFNLPVKTNDATTVVNTQIVTGINDPVPVNDWELVAYPNPTRGILNMAIRGKIYGDLNLSLTDQSGRQVIQKALGKKTVPVLQAPLNLTGLPAGMYYLNISSTKESRTIKIRLQ